ncbi:MAG: TnpV protein [Acetatifactor sp.]|nr:TnpV protein [Acetatifactor sp.]
MKSLFEQFGGTYRKENDYAIPNLEMPDTGNFEIGIYGQQHLYFLQHYRRVTYTNLLTSGKLNEYLVKIDSQARERFFRIVEQMKQEQGITEQLKSNNIIEWIRRINCIRQQVEEIIFKEIYQ